MKFQSKYENNLSKKCIWICCLSDVGHINGLVQDCSISSANALQSCTKPLIWFCMGVTVSEDSLGTCQEFVLCENDSIYITACLYHVYMNVATCLSMTCHLLLNIHMIWCWSMLVRGWTSMEVMWPTQAMGDIDSSRYPDWIWGDGTWLSFSIITNNPFGPQSSKSKLMKFAIWVYNKYGLWNGWRGELIRTQTTMMTSHEKCPWPVWYKTKLW